jgi:hypothetical protein
MLDRLTQMRIACDTQPGQELDTILVRLCEGIGGAEAYGGYLAMHGLLRVNIDLRPLVYLCGETPYLL